MGLNGRAQRPLPGIGKGTILNFAKAVNKTRKKYYEGKRV
jgi:hypothetical protein